MFRHFDGKIQAGVFSATEAEFAAVEPDYVGLPEGIIERRYDPASPEGRPQHVLITADHNQLAGPVPWPDGDAMLARADQYPALRAAAFPPDEPTPEQIIGAIRAEAERRIAAGVILEGSPFRGDETSLSRLERSARMLRGGMIPEARFVTTAGVAYAVADPDVLDNLWTAIVQYGAQVLAASTDLQQAPPASPDDVPGDAAWPAAPGLTLAGLTPAP